MSTFFSSRLWWVPLLSALLVGQAQAINKCEVDGQTIYSETPCAQGKNSVLPPLPAGDAAAQAKAQTDAARAKAELNKIEHDKQMQATREQQESKLAARQAARKAQQDKKCARLAQRKRWADDDAAQANSRRLQKAQQKARRAAEKLALECPHQG